MMTVLLLIALAGLQLSSAQRTDAVCDPGFEWAFNSMGQSPCVMTSYLLGNCQGGDFFLPALNNESVYIGPNRQINTNPCWCSSVTYSLASVCQVCQDRSKPLLEWGVWLRNCSGPDTNNGRFWPGVPVGTAVPAWAYKKYGINETFSTTSAYTFSLTNKTEYTHASPSSNPTVSATPGTSGATSSSHVPIGPIVGGVVGGLALILLSVLVWFLLRRRRAAQARARQDQQRAVFSIELKTHSRNNSADSDADSVKAKALAM